jgi:CHAD domain-containing protein
MSTSKQAGVAAAGAAAAGAAVAAGVAIKRHTGKEPRSYRFLEEERVPDALRRIARGRIDHALDELRGKTDSSPEEAVHEARKDMKKLRAVLRLARDELGDEVYRRENQCFRDAARQLSGVRDADVMLGTLKGLDGSFPELRKALKEHHRGAPREDAADEVIATLEAARDRVEEWPLESDGFDALAGGLRRIYRRGRRAWQSVEEEPNTEILHEWRKREKDLWYHLTLLRESWPPVLKVTADEAHELSDRLGDDHDHAVLEEWVHDRFDDETLAGFDQAVAARRDVLQREALDLGRRLYAERPGAFVRRLRGYWEAWRPAQSEQRPVTTSSAAAG